MAWAHLMMENQRAYICSGYVNGRSNLKLLEYEKGGLLKELETAQSQVEALLQIIPTD